MASHTQVGSVVVDAFQWLGTTTIALTTLPVWAKKLALHTPGDGSLHVPAGGNSGTLRAGPTDWVVQVASTGYIDVMSNATFTALFT